MDNELIKEAFRERGVYAKWGFRVRVNADSYHVPLPEGVEILGPLGNVRGKITGVTMCKDGVRVHVDGLPDFDL